MKTPGEGETTKGIMMSGESPSPQSEVIYDLKDTVVVSHPINVKCMHDIGVQSMPEQLDESTGSETVVYNTLAAQDMNHVLQIPPPPSRPAANRRSIENEEAIDMIEEVPLVNMAESSSVDILDSKVDEKNADTTDGQQSAKEEEQKVEDESCALQCLYFALQCCDCTIL